jgi:membrane protein
MGFGKAVRRHAPCNRGVSLSSDNAMNVKQAWALTKKSVNSWSEDYAPSMGAALSYYTLFSITPLLLIVISIAGLMFGADAVRGVIFAQLQGLMGEEGASAVQDMLSSASEPSTGGFTAIVSIIGLLIGATTVFNELQSDLDRIWRVPAPVKTSGIWTLLRTRLLSFGMIVGVIFLLTVSLVTSAALSAFGKWWGAWFGNWETLAHVLDLVVNFGLLTLIFALIYKMIPRVHVGWHDVWTGAAVTSLLFTIGKFLIGLYLGKSDVTSSFGAAGSLVIMMVWVYYSAQIFLFGAEFTWVYANMYGSRRNEAGQQKTQREQESEVPTRSDSANAPSTSSQTSSEPALARSAVGDARPSPQAHRPLPDVDATASASRASVEVLGDHRHVRSGTMSRTHKRLALGIALTTAILVGIAARVGALKRLTRSVMRSKQHTANRRLAS